MTIWTGTVPTITAGETSTYPAKVDTYRDILKATAEAWTSYGSAASFTSSGGDAALGNGTWLGKYRQVGKAVDFYVKVTLGSTTTVGTGNYRVALPVTPISTEPGMWQVVVADASAGAFYMGIVYTWTGTTASLAVINPAGGVQQVTGTVPVGVFAGDYYVVRGSYEAA